MNQEEEEQEEYEKQNEKVNQEEEQEEEEEEEEQVAFCRLKHWDQSVARRRIGSLVSQIDSIVLWPLLQLCFKIQPATAAAGGTGGGAGGTGGEGEGETGGAGGGGAREEGLALLSTRLTQLYSGRCSNHRETPFPAFASESFKCTATQDTD